MSESNGHLPANFLHFARLLRRLGLAVTPEREATVLRALGLVDLRNRRQVKDACRAVLVDRREQMEAFDSAFDLFWRAGIAAAGARVELGHLLHRSTRVQRRVVSSLFDGADGEEEGGEEMEALSLVDRRRTASRREVLAHKDFAELTPEEERELRQLMQRRIVPVGQRKSRRSEEASGGPRLDLRRSLRRNLVRGGELLELCRRRRKMKPRPLVILCDVSGSMESYSRILLQFLYAAGRSGVAGAAVPGARGRREAFAFGTRLTRLTLTLRHRDMDRALKEAASAVTDWGGGTRIGETLARFNRDWAGRVLGAGAVVLIISDGWDRGEPEVLAREMARLRRTCDRLIWLNPLLASPGYEPLARGMAAALPFVDDFLPIHNLRSLEQLGRHLAALEDRPSRRRYAAAVGGEK